MPLLLLVAACSAPPQVRLTSPVDGAFVAGTVPLGAETGADVVAVRFRVDGALVSEDARPPWSSAWAAGPDGTYVVEVVATGADGAEAVDGVTVTVDTTPPVVHLISPAGGPLAGEVTLEVEAEDANGVATVAFSVDGVAVGTDTEAPWTATWTAPATGGGTHVIEIVATDNAGNTGVAYAVVTGAETTEVAFLEPAEGAILRGAVEVSVEAGAPAGLRAVDLEVDGRTVAMSEVSPLSWSWDTCGAAEGAHTLTAVASALDGSTAEATREVFVDQALEVEILADDAPGASVVLGARVSDDREATRVTWDLDGVALGDAILGVEPVDGAGAPVYGACPLTCPDTCAWWELAVDTTTWAEGARRLTVTVTGAAGDVGSASHTLTIDRDVDGDGWEGLAAGGQDCDDGAPTVYPGAPEVLGDDVDQDCDGYAPNRRTETAVDLSRADARLVGERSSAATGASLAIVGDLDADGYDDVVVGAYGYQHRSVTGAGAAYVLFGPVTGTVDLGAADATRWGANDNDNVGRAVAAAGDVDGDGVPDVLVGAPGDDAGGASAGAVWILAGPPTGDGDFATEARVLGEAGLALGYEAAGAGDLDGDGVGDVLVGALDDEAGALAGAIWLLHGPFAGDRRVTDADAKLLGEAVGDQAYVAAGGADFDGDGVPDVLVGAQEGDAGGRQSGAAYVVLGPVAGTVSLAAADARLVGEDADDYAGYDVTWGDVDRDGYDDALIGANRDDDGGADAGAVYLVRGPVASSDLSAADGKAVGAAAADYVGGYLATDDIDGDGYDDLFAGAPGADDGGSSAGAAYLLHGPWSGTRDLGAADVILTGEDADDFACRVATGGDVDGDGWGDLLLGATGDDDGGSGAGAAYLVHSSTLGR